VGSHAVRGIAFGPVSFTTAPRNGRSPRSASHSGRCTMLEVGKAPCSFHMTFA